MCLWVNEMSTIISISSSPVLPPEPPARFTVEQYHAMIDAGVFADDDRVELLEGWLFPKIAKKAAHRYATRFLRKTFEKVLPPGWDVDSQEPVSTGDSEPEPDVSVVKEGAFDNKKRHPKVREIALLVEVSEGTLARDRGMKKRVYARANVPIYWIVNLSDKQVEVYSDPSGPVKRPDYGAMKIYKPGETIPLILDGDEIARIEVDDILP